MLPNPCFEITERMVMGWFFTTANTLTGYMPGPIVSGIASLVLPGLGQLLNGRYIRGGGLMIGWLLTSAVVMIASIFLLLVVHLVFIVTTAVDAYRIARSAAPGM